MGKMSDFLKNGPEPEKPKSKLAAFLGRKILVKPSAFTGSPEPIREAVQLSPRGKASARLQCQMAVERPLISIYRRRDEKIVVQGVQLVTGDWFRARGGLKWHGKDEYGQPTTVLISPKGPFQFRYSSRQNGRLFLVCNTMEEGQVFLFIGKEPYVAVGMDSILNHPYRIREKVRPPRVRQKSQPKAKAKVKKKGGKR